LVCWKLVRDRIAEEVRGEPGVRVFRVSGEQLDALLRAKIVEEALELAESGSVEEAADLLEALYEWLGLRGISLRVVEDVRARKREEKGGFSGGYVVVWLDRDC
jgi:predicted house-cleaning noncanonical NTP pyrophosphatase (MazG superfamily)